jgi:hypothetical protein
MGSLLFLLDLTTAWQSVAHQGRSSPTTCRPRALSRRFWIFFMRSGVHEMHVTFLGNSAKPNFDPSNSDHLRFTFPLSSIRYIVSRQSFNSY